METALVVLVPEAEVAVGGRRRRYDRSARVGVPAHVTLLYPFLDATGVEDAFPALEELFGATRAFDFSLARFGDFGDVLYLAPEPAAPFRALTANIARRWPTHPPYGGIHDDVIPHLTVAESAVRDRFDEIAAEVAARLPIRSRAVRATLLQDTDAGWTPMRYFPLRDDAAG